MDDPLPVQYGTYLWNLLHGDLGKSQLSQQPVLTDLREAIPATAELAFFAILVAVLVGVPLGIAAAIRQNKPTDHVLRVSSLAGISMPTFWLALLVLYVFFFRLGWFPGGGRLDPGVLPVEEITGMYSVDAALRGEWAIAWDAFHHLVLPALVLAAFNVSLIMRYTRSAVLEVINDDYVRAARAKGLPERTILVKHALRNALIPVVTVTSLQIGFLLVGGVLVETTLGLGGLGSLITDAIQNRDYPVIQATVLLLAVAFSVLNLLTDLLYAVIDPRLRDA